MTGGSGPDERGTWVEVPAVLGMGRAGRQQPVRAGRWCTCAERRRGRSATWLFGLVVAADLSWRCRWGNL
jgi:hypothetical protein